MAERWVKKGWNLMKIKQAVDRIPGGLGGSLCSACWWAGNGYAQKSEKFSVKLLDKFEFID